ncbi:sensor histidine kinase [Anoxynatronum sibiricum]|uniref:histidine kinase n=1 Tax=Anoxynatronum sibiricum TaxID=210623 RepID=A0ABU9VT10_9CLOT
MRDPLKILLLIWVAASLKFGETVPLQEFAGLLLLAAFYVVRARYLSNLVMIAFEGILVLILSAANPLYVTLLGITAHDLVARRWVPLVPVLLLPGIFFLDRRWFMAYLLLMAVCTYAGFQKQQLDNARRTYQQAYDQERQNRYVLEATKNQLLQAAEETTHLAEIRERNRIAREIHDSIGHDLAGNLLQLQAAERVMAKDPAKTKELIQKTVIGLAGSVELLRNTVHNIRPRQVQDWSHFQKIIDNFQYCPVDFRHQGDFSLITPHQVAILTTIIKESLTNTARHSGASRVTMELDVRDKIIRLLIQDNGSGCRQIREGMGISGMRERVYHAGGSFSVNAREGFMIVCILPRDHESGGEGNAEDHHRG